MSCVLRITAPHLDRLLPLVALTPYRVEGGTAHFSVSERDFDDLPGQVNDASAYLHAHEPDLRVLLNSTDTEGVLDFAVETRSDAFGFNAFPKSLVRDAAALGLSLELSHYPQGEGRAGA